MASFKSIESLKENFTQISTGRDVDYLIQSNSSCQIVKPRLRSLGNDDNHFKFSANYDTEDLLNGALYRIRLIKHSASAEFTAEEAESLRKCIELLKDRECYKNNSHFLEICIAYGEMSNSLSQMFDYMSSNGVGKTQASFYYLWANFLETTLRINDAKQVIELGISENAEPKNVLTQLCSDLVMRHPSLLKSSKRRISSDAYNDLPEKRKSKLTVFLDTEDDSCIESFRDSNSIIPDPASAKGENETHPNLLITKIRESPSIAQSQRTLNIYQGIGDSSLDFYSNDFIPETYNLKLLHHRKFLSAIPAFKTGSPNHFCKTSDNNKRVTSMIRVPTEIRKVLYQDHIGVTELIGPSTFGTSGDTEVLSKN